MRHDVLIIGGGLAGLRAAIEAHDAGADVAIISWVHPVRSHSGAAQGGINAALANAEKGKDDTPEKHAFDTIKGSDYLADQEAVFLMTYDGPERIIESEHWGVPYSRTAEGKIAQRPFGGAGYPRTCYAADKTGQYLLHTLYEQAVKRGIKVYSEWWVASPIIENGVSYGLVALNLATGALESFLAPATVYATGGAGRIFGRSTNSLISTGAIMGRAYMIGVPLKDLEFVQYHPTSLWGTNILISEAARGEGGYLVNKEGERFMSKYAPKAMELAPRDITSRSIQTEINEGRGFQDAYVHLDLRHLGKEKILERLPGIRDLAMKFAGVDPIEQPIPIQPGQHYNMGGIDTDADGVSPVAGLLAAGECACVSVHGANRLGGNSLLETVVFGRRAGAKAAEIVKQEWRALPLAKEAGWVREIRQQLESLLKQKGRENSAHLRDLLRQAMISKVGIFREQGAMEEALQLVKELQERSKDIRSESRVLKFNLELVRHWELEAMLHVAEAIVRGAISRQESRGSHSRRDFPERDDVNWLKHTVARYTPDGPTFEFKPVQITKYQPEARKY